MGNDVDQRIKMIRPLVDRMSHACLWSKGKNGPRRIDQKFDEASLREHAAGIRQYGLAPIAPGSDTTQVACLDFDSHKGETPIKEMLAVSQRVADVLEFEGYKPVRFTSSGGKGIHLYLIWDEPQDAYSVRRCLLKALADCLLENGTGGVHAGQVEVFPKQDSVPSDGWGNMFILPYAGSSRRIDKVAFEPSTAVPVQDRPVLNKPEHAPILNTPGLERLRSALAAIPNEDGKDLSYEDWFRIICGIHHATDGGDDGLSLAHEFSGKSGKYDQTFLEERVWPYIRSDREGSVVTASTIFTRARLHGWHDTSVAEEFDVLPAIDGDEAPPQSGRFPLIRDLVVASLPRTEWHCRDVLPIAELIILYGASGSGKSFLALDLAYAIATGTEWRGKRVKQGRVLYIAAEGAGGFRNRVRAVRAERKIEGDVEIRFLLGAPNVMSKDDIRDLCASITEEGKFDVIFIDTFAQVTPGANENAGEDMGLALRNCRTIGKVAGGTVVLVHHSGKDESRGARGWSGLHAAADAVLMVNRDGDDRCLSIAKQKDGEDGAEYPFELHSVKVDTDEHGAPITSCVIVHVERSKAQPSARNEKSPGATVPSIVMRAVEDMLGLSEAGDPVPVKTVIDQAILELPYDSEKQGGDRRRDNAMRALNALVSKGKVRVRDNLILGVT